MEIMATIYEEITINLVASTLLKNFLDSINNIFKVFYDSISLGGTLAKYLIPVQDILNLYNMSTKISEQNITGAELFSRNLQQNLYQQMTNIDFIASCDYISDPNSIFVTFTIERSGAIYIGDEKFGFISLRSDSNLYIVAAFINEKRPELHSFAFVDWYKTSNYCDHFHIYNRETDCFQFDEDGCAHAGMFCAELWENSFYKRSVESIIPVQKIYCRFFKADYKLHRSTKHIAVIPINK
ncbi:16638_t:CDS:2, partial [Dentiscutata erythropus]